MARIAVGGWQHETNSFVESRARLEDFLEPDAWPGLVEGGDLPPAVKGVNLPIAGFLEAAERMGHDQVPLVWASAGPSGPVTAEAFEIIAARLVASLAGAGRVDGLYLDLHGAMIADCFDDGEGEILRRVRCVVGPDVPIVVSLDFHANVSREMVLHSDALVGYRTYPHVDMAETGARAAHLLDRLLDGQRFFKAYRQLPFLIPMVWQGTEMKPMAGLMLEALGHEDALASLSFFPGFPLADVACAGPSVVAYGPDEDAVERAASAMAARIEGAAPAFVGELHEPADLVDAVRSLLADGGDGPIVIADTQDNPGAGGTGDTVGLIKAMARAGLPVIAGILNDPVAARAACAAGVKARLSLSVGAHLGGHGETPIEGEWAVDAIGTGEFIGTGPFYRACKFALGAMALLRQGELRVIVSERRQQAADLAMFRHVGVEPAKETIILLKSSVHFRADFVPIARAILVAVSPGANIADPRALRWRNLRPEMRLLP